MIALRSPAPEPHLTLVVPCYNGADRLPANLDALAAFVSAQPYTTELILVDDHSTDSAGVVLERFGAAHTAPCVA